MRLIKSGKVKDVYEINENELEFLFSDRISVFDKILPNSIPHKGDVLARISAYWFETVKELGIETHFIKLTAPNRMRVRKVNIITNYTLIGRRTNNYLIPLEFITRYFVYGSLWDRVKAGLVQQDQMGFPLNHAVRLGEKLPAPFFEVTTKLEKVDRIITPDEGCRISGLAGDEFEQIKEICVKIDGVIDSKARTKNLVHVDGKKEFAFNKDRRIMVVDTFGTPDEDRFWDSTQLSKGKFVERSKEFVRQYYRKIGYYDRLIQARGKGDTEPQIPPLPDEMVKQVSAVYIELFEDITDQTFR